MRSAGDGTAGLLRTERLSLIELLETLTPEDWATPSLCGVWTVRAVAAHLAWTPALGPVPATTGMIRAGFRINKFVADSAVAWSARSTDAILEQLRANAASGVKPVGVPELAPLVDAVVHGLDIRRPLNRPRALPADTFVAVADWLANLRWPGSVLLGGSAQKRIHGLRLVVDEVDWSHGSGPAVYTMPEVALLVLTGRPVWDGELNGPGAEQLYARL